MQTYTPTVKWNQKFASIHNGITAVNSTICSDMLYHCVCVSLTGNPYKCLTETICSLCHSECMSATKWTNQQILVQSICACVCVCNVIRYQTKDNYSIAGLRVWVWPLVVQWSRRTREIFRVNKLAEKESNKGLLTLCLCVCETIDRVSAASNAKWIWLVAKCI